MPFFGKVSYAVYLFFNHENCNAIVHEVENNNSAVMLELKQTNKQTPKISVGEKSGQIS